MKLFILALIILLILIILELRSCYKEGLNTSPILGIKENDSIINRNSSYSPSSSRSSILNYMNNFISYFKNDNTYKNQEKKYKLEGGSLLTLNSDVKPYTFSDDSAIIDPEAADLEAARTVAEASTASERQLWYGTDDTLKDNFKQVSGINDAMYDVSIISTTSGKTTKDNAIQACSKNAFFTGAAPEGKNAAQYGWTETATNKYPCVGFFSHSGSKAKNEAGFEVYKWSLLGNCSNGDCDLNTADQLDFPKVANLVPKKGYVMYTGSPTATVGDVFRQKESNEAGRSLVSSRVNSEHNYSEVSELNNVEIGEALLESEIDITKTQALNKCSINSLKRKGNNYCLGVAKVNDRFRYLYKGIGEYSNGDDGITNAYKKISTAEGQNKYYNYVPTEKVKGKTLYGVRLMSNTNRETVTGTIEKYDTPYKNFLDEMPNLLLKETTFDNAKSECNSRGDQCNGIIQKGNSYYLSEQIPENISVGGNITNIWVDQNKYNEQKTAFDSKKIESNSWIDELKSYFGNLNNILTKYIKLDEANKVVLDGSVNGGIYDLNENLEKCQGNKGNNNVYNINDPMFPENASQFAQGKKSGQSKKPKCVGILTQPNNNGVITYHYTRFLSPGNDANSAGDNIGVEKEIIKTDGIYDNFYAHSINYEAGDITRVKSILDSISSTLDNKFVELKDKFSDLSRISANAVSDNVLQIFRESTRIFIGQEGLSDSLYSLINTMEEKQIELNSSGEDTSILGDYNSSANRLTFIEEMEKKFIKILIGYLHFDLFVSFNNERMQLDTYKNQLNSLYSSLVIKKEINNFESKISELGLNGINITKTTTDLQNAINSFETNTLLENLEKNDYITQIISIAGRNTSLTNSGMVITSKNNTLPEFVSLLDKLVKHCKYSEFPYENMNDSNKNTCYKSYNSSLLDEEKNEDDTVKYNSGMNLTPETVDINKIKDYLISQLTEIETTINNYKILYDTSLNNLKTVRSNYSSSNDFEYTDTESKTDYGDYNSKKSIFGTLQFVLDKCNDDENCLGISQSEREGFTSDIVTDELLNQKNLNTDDDNTFLNKKNYDLLYMKSSGQKIEKSEPHWLENLKGNIKYIWKKNIYSIDGDASSGLVYDRNKLLLDEVKNINSENLTLDELNNIISRLKDTYGLDDNNQYILLANEKLALLTFNQFISNTTSMNSNTTIEDAFTILNTLPAIETYVESQNDSAKTSSINTAKGKIRTYFNNIPGDKTTEVNNKITTLSDDNSLKSELSGKFMGAYFKSMYDIYYTNGITNRAAAPTRTSGESLFMTQEKVYKYVEDLIRGNSLPGYNNLSSDEQSNLRSNARLYYNHLRSNGEEKEADSVKQIINNNEDALTLITKNKLIISDNIIGNGKSLGDYINDADAINSITDFVEIAYKILGYNGDPRVGEVYINQIWNSSDKGKWLPNVGRVCKSGYTLKLNEPADYKMPPTDGWDHFTCQNDSVNTDQCSLIRPTQRNNQSDNIKNLPYCGNPQSEIYSVCKGKLEILVKKICGSTGILGFANMPRLAANQLPLDENYLLNNIPNLLNIYFRGEWSGGLPYLLFDIYPEVLTKVWYDNNIKDTGQIRRDRISRFNDLQTLVDYKYALFGYPLEKLILTILESYLFTEDGIGKLLPRPSTFSSIIQVNSIKNKFGTMTDAVSSNNTEIIDQWDSFWSEGGRSAGVNGKKYPFEEINNSIGSPVHKFFAYMTLLNKIGQVQQKYTQVSFQHSFVTNSQTNQLAEYIAILPKNDIQIIINTIYPTDKSGIETEDMILTSDGETLKTRLQQLIQGADSEIEYVLGNGGFLRVENSDTLIEAQANMKSYDNLNATNLAIKKKMYENFNSFAGAPNANNFFGSETNQKYIKPGYDFLEEKVPIRWTMTGGEPNSKYDNKYKVVPVNQTIFNTIKQQYDADKGRGGGGGKGGTEEVWGGTWTMAYLSDTLGLNFGLDVDDSLYRDLNITDFKTKLKLENPHYKIEFDEIDQGGLTYQGPKSVKNYFILEFSGVAELYYGNTTLSKTKATDSNPLIFKKLIPLGGNGQLAQNFSIILLQYELQDGVPFIVERTDRL